MNVTELFPRAATAAPKAEKPKATAPTISECGVYGLIATCAALGAWYYSDTGDNPLIMVPLTLASAVIGAKWVEHTAASGWPVKRIVERRKTKYTFHPKALISAVILLVAASVNSIGAYRALDYLNAKQNAPADARDAERAPVLIKLEAAKKAQQTAQARLDAIKPLTPEQRAAMPTTRAQNDKAQTDADIAAATDALNAATAQASAEQAKLKPAIRRKQSIPPQLAFGWEFINIFGLWTCRNRNVEGHGTITAKKGWETRRANQAKKRNQKLKQSA